MPSEKPIISLFSGALGLDLGLEAASGGLRTAVAVEMSPVAATTIQLNRPNIPILNKSIESIKTSELLEAAGLKRGEVFLVTGGPCCQSFSTVGKRMSLADEKRGGLFLHFTRIVRETRPRFFVMENVKGVLSAAIRHRPLNKRGPGHPPLAVDEELGSALKTICKELAKLKYHVIYTLVNCADYGVPQKRYRVIFIGSRDGEPIRIPDATHAENGTPAWITLKDTIANLVDDEPEFNVFTPHRAKLLSHLKAGQNWVSLPKKLQRKALGAALDSWGGRSGFCRRLSWNQPAPTLTSSPDGRATTLCHPTELRPLSIKEYALLQQFPSEWKFAGSTRQKYLQIGNAVPIGLGKAIGTMLLDVAKRPKKSKDSSAPSLQLGKVTCADPVLEGRLKNRSRTKLNPVRMREIQKDGEARKWLQKVGK